MSLSRFATLCGKLHESINANTLDEDEQQLVAEFSLVELPLDQDVPMVSPNAFEGSIDVTAVDKLHSLVEQTATSDVIADNILAYLADDTEDEVKAREVCRMYYRTIADALPSLRSIWKAKEQVCDTLEELQEKRRKRYPITSKAVDKYAGQKYNSSGKTIRAVFQDGLK